MSKVYMSELNFYLSRTIRHRFWCTLPLPLLRECIHMSICGCLKMRFVGLQLITNLLGNLVLALPGDLKAEDPGSIRNRPDLYSGSWSCWGTEGTANSWTISSLLYHLTGSAFTSVPQPFHLIGSVKMGSAMRTSKMQYYYRCRLAMCWQTFCYISLPTLH